MGAYEAQLAEMANSYVCDKGTEIWVVIPGFDNNYEVSNMGNVWSRATGKCMKGTVGVQGYKMVTLTYSDGSQIGVNIHNLVAKAFLPNPNHFPIVMHKDGDKTNNKVSNLKWGTHSEANSTPEYRERCRESAAKRFGTIHCYKDGIEVTARTTREASDRTGISKSVISYALNHNPQTRSGWYFKRIKEGEENDS